jgi:hypothetical protein
MHQIPFRMSKKLQNKKSDRYKIYSSIILHSTNISIELFTRVDHDDM